jgi:hypothetical protein
MRKLGVKQERAAVAPSSESAAAQAPGHEAALALPLVLVLAAWAACGGEPLAAPAPPRLPDSRRSTVAAGGGARERSWDGVVEAVQQATLSAQTADACWRCPSTSTTTSGRRGAGALHRVEQQSARAGARRSCSRGAGRGREAEAEYRGSPSCTSGACRARSSTRPRARAIRPSRARSMRRRRSAKAGQSRPTTRSCARRTPASSPQRWSSPARPCAQGSR